MGTHSTLLLGMLGMRVANMTCVSVPGASRAQANRAHTYLGLREKEYHVTGDLKDIFPDFVLMAAAFGVPAKRVTRPHDLRAAIQCARFLSLHRVASALCCGTHATLSCSSTHATLSCSACAALSCSTEANARTTMQHATNTA